MIDLLFALSVLVGMVTLLVCALAWFGHDPVNVPRPDPVPTEDPGDGGLPTVPDYIPDWVAPDA